MTTKSRSARPSRGRATSTIHSLEDPRMRQSCPLTLTGVVLSTVVLSGCSKTGAGPSYGGEEGRKIAQLVELVNDEKSTAPNLARLFVKGAAPKDSRKYPLYYYEVSGNPTVSGDTATAMVKVKLEAGEETVEKEWSFAKEGEAWKIKSAPLP